MENTNIIKATVLKPDTIVFDLSHGDNFKLENAALLAVKNYKRETSSDIMIIRQSFIDQFTPPQS